MKINCIGRGGYVTLMTGLLTGHPEGDKKMSFPEFVESIFIATALASIVLLGFQIKAISRLKIK